MKKNKDREQLEERIREISIEYGEIQRKLEKISAKEREESIKERDNMVCYCGHKYRNHGKSFSLNFIAGACKNCKCNNFIEKDSTKHRSKEIRNKKYYKRK